MNKAVVWTEIYSILERAKHRLPIVSQTMTEIRLGQKNFILGISASDAGRLQGHHSEHMLVIVDEAAAIDESFWPAIEGVLASGDSRLVISGNPTTVGGFFYDAFGRNRARWECIQISAFDSENLEGLTLESLLSMSDADLDTNQWPTITRRWVAERFKEWFNGSPENSPLWQSRVLGQFPSTASNALVPLSALETARRPAQDKGGRVVVGVDPAGPGRDRTAAVACADGAIIDVGVWTDADSRGAVVAFVRKHAERLRIVRVDSIGLGFHLANHVRDCGFRTEGSTSRCRPKIRALRQREG